MALGEVEGAFVFAPHGAVSDYITVQLVIDLTNRLGLARKTTADLTRILGHPARTLARFIHDHRTTWF